MLKYSQKELKERQRRGDRTLFNLLPVNSVRHNLALKLVPVFLGLLLFIGFLLLLSKFIGE